MTLPPKENLWEVLLPAPTVHLPGTCTIVNYTNENFNMLFVNRYYSQTMSQTTGQELADNLRVCMAGKMPDIDKVHVHVHVYQC